MGWNDFSLPGCGETYDNEDGTSRQEELRRCEPGEFISLVREPDNPHDPMAVAIVSARGIRVGYLRRDRAQWIGSKLDRGYAVSAIVERVKGIDLPGSRLGIVVRLSLDPEFAEEPDLPRPKRAGLGPHRDRKLEFVRSAFSQNCGDYDAFP